ncbi:hypothetical protein AAKU64_004467 [Undibacterium sp. GrIS 1.8]|uniref:DUF3617 domain-containing protein n=1 Tax=unclassified Undibacterium TaxID=2630295 RepID=UPI0033966FBD
MRSTIQLISLSLCALSLVSNAEAAGKSKAGLWEVTIQSDAMKNMPTIPPEQLEKLKQMGIKIPNMQNGGMTTQMCITKEMADRDQPPVNFKDQSGCQSKNIQKNGNTWSMDLVCDKPEMKGSGKVTGTYLGDDSVQSVFDFKGIANDKPINMHSETKSKWLSADCGDIKPLDLPKNK